MNYIINKLKIRQCYSPLNKLEISQFPHFPHSHWSTLRSLPLVHTVLTPHVHSFLTPHVHSPLTPQVHYVLTLQVHSPHSKLKSLCIEYNNGTSMILKLTSTPRCQEPIYATLPRNGSSACLSPLPTPLREEGLLPYVAREEESCHRM